MWHKCVKIVSNSQKLTTFYGTAENRPGAEMIDRNLQLRHFDTFVSIVSNCLKISKCLKMSRNVLTLTLRMDGDFVQKVTKWHKCLNCLNVSKCLKCLKDTRILRHYGYSLLHI